MRPQMEKVAHLDSGNQSYLIMMCRKNRIYICHSVIKTPLGMCTVVTYFAQATSTDDLIQFILRPVMSRDQTNKPWTASVARSRHRASMTSTRTCSNSPTCIHKLDNLVTVPDDTMVNVTPLLHQRRYYNDKI